MGQKLEIPETCCKMKCRLDVSLDNPQDNYSRDDLSLHKYSFSFSHFELLLSV